MNAYVKEWEDADNVGTGMEDAMRDVMLDVIRMSAQATVNISTNLYAIMIGIMCAAVLWILIVLNYIYGVPTAGWMSSLLLPMPTCMLLYHIRDRFAPSVSNRWLVRWWPVMVVPTVLMAVLILTVAVGQKAIANRDTVVELELAIGIFAVIATMAVIIAGGIGLRLMHIDKEYRSVADRIKTRPTTDDAPRSAVMSAGEHVAGAPKVATRSQHDIHMELSDVRGKIEANRRGVLVDGICMFMILVVGLTTALNFSPGLHVSAALSVTCFLSAAVPFHYHAQNILGERH